MDDCLAIFVFLLILLCDVHVQIGPFQSTKSERAKLKVKVRLNLHGIVSVESATVSSVSSCNCNYCWTIFLQAIYLFIF
jgi:hypothetical protein